MFGFLDKIANWFPSKGEHLRLKIAAVKKDMENELNKPSKEFSSDRYGKLARELRKLEEAAQARVT